MMTLQHKYVKVLAKVVAPEEVTVRWWHQMVAPVWVVAQNGGLRLGSGTRLDGGNKWWHQTQHRLGVVTPRFTVDLSHIVPRVTILYGWPSATADDGC